MVSKRVSSLLVSKGMEEIAGGFSSLAEAMVMEAIVGRGDGCERRKWWWIDFGSSDSYRTVSLVANLGTRTAVWMGTCLTLRGYSLLRAGHAVTCVFLIGCAVCKLQSSSAQQLDWGFEGVP